MSREAQLEDALRGMQRVYCLRVCHACDGDAELKPDDHTPRCRDVTALLANEKTERAGQ